jgi:aryl-alcohol dehydrogenase-like predicted oxidoreductase
MAGGVLTGKYNTDQKVAGRFTSYAVSDDPRMKAMARRFLNEKTLASTARYMKIAKEAKISPATLAVAWSKQFDFVASTIIGVTTAEQLDDSLAAIDFELSEDVLRKCDEVHNEILYPMG